MIPFTIPRIDNKTIDAVIEVLNSGWITTGKKTKAFEESIAQYVGVSDSLCVNAATSGIELMLRWFGVKEGDEVIIPAYTYCATANVVMHCGAKPVMVDVQDDFNIDINLIKKAITTKTKVIIPVDLGGWPCDYDALYDLISLSEIQQQFISESSEQKKLARIMILADAAHSLGGVYKSKRVGALADITVFSFHAVKNLTTAEGGAICFNLPSSFDNDVLCDKLRTTALHGQSKDALSKNRMGQWEYDVFDAGYKYNMPDILASMGLVEIERYEEQLRRRKVIAQMYDNALKGMEWAELPMQLNDQSESSYHLYPLRIRGINEEQRNSIIQLIFSKEVAVNVHFKPLPLLSFYKNLGYQIKDYPVAYDNYEREISLPIYYDLTDDQVDTVIDVVVNAVNKVI